MVIALALAREVLMDNIARLIAMGILEDDKCLTDDERKAINNIDMQDTEVESLVRIKDQLALSPVKCEDLHTIIELRRL
jgi:hypothetical protein